MDDNIERINLFESDELVSIISDMMNNVDEMKNSLPEKFEDITINFVDKVFFKRVFSDITDIELKDDVLKVYFERGVDLHIDSAATGVETYNRFIKDADYRSLKIIGELIDLGEISLRTSPFVVVMWQEGLRSDYRESLDQSLFREPKAVNLHDNGINCWGGWGGPIRSNYDDLNLENSLMFMIQRMKQLNIDDYARSISGISTLLKSSYMSLPININPIVIARLIVEYDLQDLLIDNPDFLYFSRGYNGNLEIIDGVKTTINYQTFIELVRQFNNNHKGIKPKISLKTSDN